MPVSTGYCPQCGTQRTGALRYCAGCAYDFWAGATEPAPATSPLPAASGDPAPPVQTAPVRSGRDFTLLWLMLVPGVIGAVLLGLLTKLDPWGFGIGGFIGLAIGAWIQKIYMETSNYSNLRRIGRK